MTKMIIRFNPARLRAIREQRGLSQDNFAATLGVSRGLLDSVERGLCKPRTAMIESVCNTYNVDPGFLFAWPDVDHIA